MIGSLFSRLGFKGKPDASFETLVKKARADLQTKTASHQAMWGLGKATRWDLDQAEGLLVFTFPDKTVTCEAQIIGSLDKSTGTWLWAWDNGDIATNLTTASRQLRDYGEQHGFDKLTRAEWEASEEEAWDMVALATLVGEAQGAYRGPAGDVFVFMTFGAPKILKSETDPGAPADGTQSSGPDADPTSSEPDSRR